MLAAGAVIGLSGVGTAHAATVNDAQNEFVLGYSGVKTGDLDIRRFRVDYDPTTQVFNLGATFDGPINSASQGFYVIGVNTGTGALRPFAVLGQPDVIFDQAVVIQKTGAGSINVAGVPDALTATILGKSFNVVVPLSLLPSTGVQPLDYGFNLWSRQPTGGLQALADFAPEDAVITAVPEPANWAIMFTALGLTATALRRRRRSRA